MRGKGSEFVLDGFEDKDPQALKRGHDGAKQVPTETRSDLISDPVRPQLTYSLALSRLPCSLQIAYKSDSFQRTACS